MYKQPLKAPRTGALFSAFPYSTKISPETIALFIATHTKPGDTVFDGFAGSGTTGVAALLCSEPTDAMREEARRLGLTVKWGPRRAVLYEVGVLGSFVGRTLTNPPDPEEFHREAERILVECERSVSWMYEARDPDGRNGTIRYIIWSEVVECPDCGKAVTVFDGCVGRQPAKISGTFSCANCSRKANLSECKRLTKTYVDKWTGEELVGRIRKPVWMYGATGNRDWSRAIQSSDCVLVERIEGTALPDSVPRVRIPWGDLYRSGYHQGITHLHHFYTRRNLIIFAKLWELAASSPVADALRFWLLSYNASHGTLMTRVVAKKKQKDLVVTSGQPGVLYVSGLPVEKNLFAGLKRKLTTIHAAFTITRRNQRLVDVRHGSCLRTSLSDQSIDYVFTDPPFGGNIPYAEVNFINEAWLGSLTDSRDEITISRVQGKTCNDYESLMAQAFLEIHRLLKRNGKVTAVFHSASSTVWNALHRAYNAAGLSVKLANVLNKTQGSFKQVTAAGAVKGDPVLLLTKRRTPRRPARAAVRSVAAALIARAHNSHDLIERTPQRLYSRFVTHYLTREQSVPIDADEFYRLIAARSLREDARSSA